jgi:hypothetical protein
MNTVIDQTRPWPERPRQVRANTGDGEPDESDESGDGGPQAGGEVFGATARSASDVSDTVGGVTVDGNASRASGGTTPTSTTCRAGAGAWPGFATSGQ